MTTAGRHSPSRWAAPARRLLRRLLVVAAALVAAAAAMTAVGGVAQDIGPVQTTLSLQVSATGGTHVAVPPVGRLMMDTHRGPLRLSAEVEGVDVTAVRSVLQEGAPTLDADGARADLRSGLSRLALRSGVVALLAAAAVSGALFRRWRAVALGTASAALALAAGAGVAAATFDPDAVGEPTYDGLLAQAPALVGRVADARSAVDAYGGRVTQLADNVARLYGTLTALPEDPGQDATRVLWVSDIHNNPAAYRVMAALVAQFDVQAIVDTGDSTDVGSALENSIHAPVADLGVPYLWVRGNHDSAVTQAYLDALPNVTVLDGPQVVEAAGIRWAGVGDPRYAPFRRVEDEAPTGALRAAGRQLRDGLARQDAPPDAVLVHEPPMAEALHGEVPLVLDGHVHERRERRVEGTLELTLGSSGGAGLRTFDGAGASPLQMSVLHFDPDARTLLAVDEVTVAGVDEQEVTFARRSATSLAVDD